MKYDVAVIGGGPAGMMAAGRAGANGARVILIEKNKSLGIKLLMTGKGRCNITNNSDNIRELVLKFGKNGKFLFSALNKFGVSEVIDFFENRGVKTKVERGNRIFPKSDDARTVLKSLLDYLKENKVDIKTSAEVKKIVVHPSVIPAPEGIAKAGIQKIEKIILKNGDEIIADKFIICTGGKSYPHTGSNGDGYKWLEKLGHTIVKPKPALTPVILKEKFIKNLEGLSLKNVEISIYKNGRKIDSRFGEALFTNNGMSGPIILDMSKFIGENLPNLKLKIDFKPALDFSKLKERIERDFHVNSNKQFKNILGGLLPQKMIPVFIKSTKIKPEKKINSITKDEKNKIIHLLKEFELEVVDLVGFEKAIVTAGGVELSEVDPKTMKSKKVGNLFFAGEILDIDGPTGGYNLQNCWSTGFVAGESVLK